MSSCSDRTRPRLGDAWQRVEQHRSLTGARLLRTARVVPSLGAGGSFCAFREIVNAKIAAS